MRTCKSCGYEGPPEEFKVAKVLPSGRVVRVGVCTPCKRQADRAAQQRYRAKYKDLLLARNSKWAKDNAPIKAALNAEYQMRKTSQTPPWADKQQIREIYKRAARLTVETGISHHVDHVYPLRSAIICGLHVQQNLQVLPAILNMKKSNKLTIDSLTIHRILDDNVDASPSDDSPDVVFVQ